MPNHYLDFLDQRAAQRRLKAKFSQPYALLLHAVAFVIVMTGFWAYLLAWLALDYRLDWSPLAMVGLGWSVLLAVHALIQYRRSAADGKRRDLAIEDEMRQFIEKNGDQVDDDDLFAMHRALSSDLERDGRWSLGLVIFSVINVVNWVIAAVNMGTSWAFQLTLPAAVVFIGGSYMYQMWQQNRTAGRDTWFTRVPLVHIGAYVIGTIALALLGMLRLINPWDVNTLVGWWTIALVSHIALAVLILPLLNWIFRGRSASLAKRKPAEHLMLDDDGEIVEVVEPGAPSYQTNTR